MTITCQYCGHELANVDSRGVHYPHCYCTSRKTEKKIQNQHRMYDVVIVTLKCPNCGCKLQTKELI